MSTDAYGAFPFGQPNTVRPMREAVRPAKALVVGVYPSAFHVAWSPPPLHDPRIESERNRPYIGSLAVDVEPVVFWDGDDPTPSDRLEQWKVAVGFDEARHGRVAIGNNGPSGAGLRDHILKPLRIDVAEVAFTDTIPWFFIKSGPKSQGDAIQTRFAPVAAKMAVHAGSLPKRPSPAQLVKLAATARRESLPAEIAEAGAPLVITLGQEALDAVRAVADRCEGVQARLAPDQNYGTRGELTIGGSTFELLPLAHPGFQRQTTRPEWTSAFAGWAEGLRS